MANKEKKIKFKATRRQFMENWAEFSASIMVGKNILPLPEHISIILMCIIGTEFEKFMFKNYAVEPKPEKTEEIENKEEQ